MNVTVSVDDEVISRARRRAEALGTSVEQLLREYVEQLAGKVEFAEAARVNDYETVGKEVY